MSFSEKKTEFFSDICVYLHQGNFLTFLRMGQFSDIVSLPEQKNLDIFTYNPPAVEASKRRDC